MNFEPLTRFMDYMSRERTPGNAIMVYLGGKCVYRYACGYAELESKTPLTGEEFFNLYSCSKITTVTAGLQLLEKGRFLLTDPLYEYIPESGNVCENPRRGAGQGKKSYYHPGSVLYVRRLFL